MTSRASPNHLPTSHHRHRLHLDKAPMNRAPFLSTPPAKPFPSCIACLKTVADKVKKEGLRPPGIIVVGDVVALSEKLELFGIAGHGSYD